MRRAVRQLEAIAQKMAIEKEREHFVVRAIKSRMRRKQPLDADALAQEAIRLADRGTSYSEFIHDKDPEKWRDGVFNLYRAEVGRQLDSRRSV